ncbi:TetR/AcrR family transcriptional regulator [Halobacillus sp. KGW1]|uniref:TetR/AcrR family transcriptional regulator n=1 Tax=Halobacillus sp. KGW1 TaxID=1793726 RepID=UPI000781132F|nr:TetR/AcrR family transcriptional regulator [Halobacillus sp. KGW1]
MKAEHIKEIAWNQFARHGYQGASLASIAEEVGIKKQSIYAHFKNKEDLFLRTFEEALAGEIQFIQSFMADKESKPLREVLRTFSQDYLERYEKDNSMGFFLRTSFFPPATFEEDIKRGTNAFVEQLEQVLLELIEQRSEELQPGISPESAMVTYLTILDGLFVELLYGFPTRLERRMDLTWHTFSKHLKEEDKQ